MEKKSMNICIFMWHIHTYIYIFYYMYLFIYIILRPHIYIYTYVLECDIWNKLCDDRMRLTDMMTMHRIA
jgi:hypothetical protein